MTVVRKHLCTGDHNRKVGRSESVDRIFGIEYSLLYLMERLEIVMNKVRFSECKSNGTFYSDIPEE
jgi:hypothetical protein